MRLSKFLHSCVLLEGNGSSILFDPGKFSFIEGLVLPGSFRNLSAILLTHGHPDHLDIDALSAIIAANPAATIYGNGETLADLGKSHIKAILFETGSRQVGGLNVQAIPAEHAPILGSPAPQNTAFLVDNLLLNPGDSFAPALDAFRGTPALLLPVMAPWEKELEMMAFAERMKPQIVVPVHDGHAKSFFLHQRYATFKQEFERRGIRFAELYEPGAGMDLPA